MKRKNYLPFCWLLLIPFQLTADILFIRIGAWLDLHLLTRPDAYGHGIPFFSAIFLLIASVITLVIFIFAVSMFVKGFRRQQK